MNTNEQFPTASVACLVVLAAVFFLNSGSAPSPAPAPSPVPGGPDLVSVFRANPDRIRAKGHAAEFAAICLETANDLRIDGELPAEKQRIQSGVHVSAFRGDIRYFAADGQSYASFYPTLKPTVAEYLDRTAGKDSGPLTPEQRAKWVSALKSLGESAKYAESSL